MTNSEKREKEIPDRRDLASGDFKINRKAHGQSVSRNRIARSIWKNLAILFEKLIDAHRHYSSLKKAEKYLYAMSDRQLRDIGLSRCDINAALLDTKSKLYKEKMNWAGNDNEHRRAG